MAKNNKDSVLLLDCLPSAFGMRVRIALAEKGVDYEYIEEDLKNKSELLLQMNPVHKKIPVLIHNGRPICESAIIVQYIDEVWSHVNSARLLPTDPYERAQARFWADFVDKKMYDLRKNIYMCKKDQKKELEAASKEFINFYKVIEDIVLRDKPYLGGDSFGFLDVVYIAHWSWLYSMETLGGFKLEDSCPKLAGWASRCMEKDSVSKSLPHHLKIHDVVLQRRRTLGVE